MLNVYFSHVHNTHQFLQYALVTVCIIIMEIVSGVSGVVEFLKVVSLQNYSYLLSSLKIYFVKSITVTMLYMKG